MCPLSEKMSSLCETMSLRCRRLPREGYAWEDYHSYPDPDFRGGLGSDWCHHTDNVYIFVFYCYIRVLLIKPSSMIYCMLYIKYAEKVARRLR